MENGVSGVHGISAQKHAREALAPALVLAVTPHQQVKAYHAQVMQGSQRTAIYHNAHVSTSSTTRDKYFFKSN